ncbi:MAG: SGNH/GDSL hydrolase family protein, partial [Methylocapsa sp.]|nr:SGNH/GDSL hydrolase family protein [Methylocapsa sp.]
TFGDGLNDDETLPQLFADSIGRQERVLNLGFSGYGPQQFLRELQSGTYDSVIGPHPKLVVILTSVIHAERCACKVHWARRGPRYIIENGKLILKGTCYEGPRLWWEEWLQNSAAYRWLVAPYRRALSHDDVELYIQITLAVVNLARSKYGAPAVVLYFNWDENYLRGTGFTNADIMQRMQDGGAAVVDASLGNEAAAGMALNIPGDGHPTGLANRLRAALLKNYLEQNMPGVLASNRN